MSKTLITGGTGLVGATLTRRLVAEGAAVRILRRPTSSLALLGEAADQVEHAVGDVTEPATLTAAFADVTHVYHTAAYVGLGGRRDRRQLYAVNVQGTAHVVDAALRAGVTRLVHTSSIAALGRPEQEGGVLDERAEWHRSRMNTHYAASKYEAELEVYRGVAEGLDAVLVNPSLIFGPARPGENTRQLVERVRDGKMPGVPPGGTNAVDVRDVVDGHLRAMAQGASGERYLLTGENLSWRELVETLADAFGVTPPQRTLPAWALQVAAAAGETASLLTGARPPLTRAAARAASRTYRYDSAKAQTALGWTYRPWRETAAYLAEEIGR